MSCIRSWLKFLRVRRDPLRRLLGLDDHCFQEMYRISRYFEAELLLSVSNSEFVRLT